MKNVVFALVLLLAALACGCQHLVEANSDPSDKTSDKEDQAQDRWWQRIDLNGPGGTTAPR